MHATILAYMFSLVETGRIKVPLGPTPDNVRYVQDYVANLLKSAFPHLSDNQIKITVQGLFNLDQDIPGFKEHLRDFLVQIRVSLLFGVSRVKGRDSFLESGTRHRTRTTATSRRDHFVGCSASAFKERVRKNSVGTRVLLLHSRSYQCLPQR